MKDHDAKPPTTPGIPCPENRPRRPLARWRTALALVAIGLLIGVWPVFVSVAPAALASTAPESLTSEVAGTPEVVGPFTHDNLALYLLRGEDRLELDGLLTLAQALDEGKAVVHETGDVNTLSVENLADVGVFIEAGDIVKGGRQDRVLATDLVLPPKSGPVSVAAFCVESGRWSPREAEAPGHFASSDEALPARRLKLAAREAKNQSAVWAEVEQLQERLATVAAAPVTDERSRTSLQLTLENEVVQEGADRYVEALKPELEEFDDVIGYAFAVNGEVVSTDVYGAARLARERATKLLRAAAVEALAERDAESRRNPPPPASAVAELLARADRRAHSDRNGEQDTLELILDGEAGSYHLLESRGSEKKLLHRAMVLRKPGS